MICRCSLADALHRLKELIRSDVINSSLLEVMVLDANIRDNGFNDIQ